MSDQLGQAVESVGDLLRSLRDLRLQQGPDDLSKRHQPLTLLLLIARARQGRSRLISWPEARDVIGHLIRDYGRATDRSNPYLPFLALARSGLSELKPSPPRGLAGSARLEWLNNTRPVVQGGLSEPVYNLLAESKDATVQAVGVLLSDHFDIGEWDGVLAAVGLSSLANVLRSYPGLGRARSARSAADAWTQVQAICREAMAAGRTIATIDQGVANRILDVRPAEIVRASADARTPDGQGASVTRLMVERIWHELAASSHANRIPGVLYFAYALVAEIPGVAVDSDQHGLRIADWDLAMTHYRDTTRVGETTFDRRYWTLASNPRHFRVVDAVHDLDEDWWTTRGARIHAGDRVAIWKYKGSSDHRGIIAFGEVLTDPEPRGPADDELTYWIGSDGLAVEPRVSVRYVIKLSEPLWYELAPFDSVIRQLPVSRAQGGTAHQVKPDQWEQLMALVGGWPKPDADGHDGGTIWADAEIKQAVASYHAMLRAELRGQPYVKADFNRAVRAATGRSRGSVEYKFANISAALRDIGLPFVLGYQPRGNYQSALRAEVERFHSGDAELPSLLEEISGPDLPETVQLVKVDPPVMPPAGNGRRGRTALGADYVSRQERNQDVGLKGERLVVKYERACLTAYGRPDLAERVKHIPTTLGDGAGYDVSSFLLDGSPHYIEVKTTCGSINVPFFLSSNELRHALENTESYSIYRVFDLGPNPKFYKLTGNIEEILDLSPVSYQARVKAPGNER